VVTTGRARVHEIVAITFTEKAAGELKVRVREEIENRLHSASSGPLPAVLRQALEDLERAQITTIHAFCAGLLRERPVEAAVDPQFGVADELQTRLLFDEAWRRWLEGELTQNPPALRHALVRELRLETLRELAELLVEQRTRLETARWPAVVPVDLPAVRQRLQTAEPALARSVIHCVAKRAGFCVTAQTLLDALPQLADAAPDRATAVLSALELKQPRAKTEFDSEAAFRDAKTLVKDLQPVLAEFAAAAAHNFLVEIVAWLRGFTGFYQEFKRAQAVLDFDDLLIKARDLLRTEVGGEFQQRIKFLLVDEFQDTDPVQTELVRQLAGQVPGKLFIVGDPKQSIYGFRRADIEMYAGVRKELSKTGQVVQFQQNFRSQATIVAWVNAVFRKIFTPADFQPEYIELSPWHPPAGKVALLRPHEWPANQNIAATRTAEATAIARYLHQQVAVQACRWGEVALLFRSFTGVEQFADVFSAAGVPFRIVGGKGYYQRQEIQTLIALLCCLDNPSDTLNLVAVLRSPLFGWTDEQIFLAHAAGRLNYLGDDTGTTASGDAAYKLLRELHESRHVGSVAAFLERVLARTHFCQAVFAVGPDGGAGVANLLKALELARQLEAAGRRSLRGLVRQLRATIINGLDEEPAPANQENQDVVQLLTMHKSKGLQFPVVVLADLAGKSQDNQMCLVPTRATGEFQLRCAGCRTAAFDAAKKDQDQRDEAEEIRLLYVAATRAERQLVIPWFKETGERLDLLRKGFEPVASELVEVDFGVRQLVDAVATDGQAATSRVGRDVAAGCDKPAVETNGKAVTSHRTPKELLAERQRWQTERTALLARVTVSAVRASPSKLAHEAEASEEEPGGGRAAGLDLGVVVHAALERMDATGLPDEARELVERALQSELFNRVGAADEVYRELPFAAGPLEGKIDLLFREGDRWVLVDYKTDTQPDAERYRPQLHAYAAALRQVAGIVVAEQWLFFLNTGEMVSVG